MKNLALLLCLLALAAGCGESSDEPEGSLTLGEVASEFKAQTGDELVKTSLQSDPRWDVLGLGENPSPKQQARYGVFSIYVVKRDTREAVGSILAAKTTKEPLARSENGIYWERDSFSGSWIAHKRIGPNVVLAWFTESNQRRTDARWKRLTSALAGLG